MLKDYLKNKRLFYTFKGSEKSILLTSGVPQGSIPGLTLCTLFYGLVLESMPQGMELLAFMNDVTMITKSSVTFRVKELLGKAAEIAFNDLTKRD